MKKCNTCNVPKSKECFHRSSQAKDGRRGACKACRVIKGRTVRGLVTKIYSAQRQSSRLRGHTNPDYSLHDLLTWAAFNSSFRSTYNAWVASGYDPLKIPSLDRLDDYKPYTLDNLQVLTWQDNKRKFDSDRISGKNNKKSKAINQLSLDGSLIKKFYSAMQASRELDRADYRNISACCHGLRKTHAGYRWEFA